MAQHKRMRDGSSARSGEAVSQRDSGYERKERDLYETPSWVTMALLPHLPDRDLRCLGAGLRQRQDGPRSGRQRFFSTVLASDIDQGRDFLEERSADGWEAIITNPPYDPGVRIHLAWNRCLNPPRARAGGDAIADRLRSRADAARTLFDQFANSFREKGRADESASSGSRTRPARLRSTTLGSSGTGSTRERRRWRMAHDRPLRSRRTT
jgi:hypothetical protein